MKYKLTNATLLILSVITLLLMSTAVSFAYFSAAIYGSETKTTMSGLSGNMTIHYDGGPDITTDILMPSNDPIAIKVFTVTGNTNTPEDMHYQTALLFTENTFSDDVLHYKLLSENTGGNGTITGSMENTKGITTGESKIVMGRGSFTGPTNGDKVHTYTLELYFPETGEDQSVEMNKTFQARVLIEESDPNLATDEDFIFVEYSWAPNIYNGVRGYYQYTGDKTEVTIPEQINGETLKDTYEMFYQNSTVTKVNIDNSNVTNMSYMFALSSVISLDLSSFYTSNVTSMEGMFSYSSATSLDLNSFDTSNVTNMSYMFNGSKATSLGLSNFNTSNVTSMEGMFFGSSATSLNLITFDTSNVTNMSYMFNDSSATSLDLGSFHTSNVIDMSYMFEGSSATSLNLITFDTSNVIDMSSMFRDSSATSLDLSSFDTSNVIGMSYMFAYSSATSLDLSSFYTSNVTSMEGMFSYSSATSLDLNSFDTSNVTNMSYMFNGSKATSLGLSSFDTSNVKSMSSMFAYSPATTGYARTLDDANRFNSSSGKPAALTFVVKP